ncbi:hypothetical protein [Eubacterium sp.]
MGLFGFLNKFNSNEKLNLNKSLDKKTIDELRAEYDALMGIRIDKTLADGAKGIVDNSYPETDKLIAICLELSRRNDSLGKLDLMHSYNLKLQESWCEDIKNKNLELYDEACIIENTEPGVRAAADYYIAEMCRIEMWEKTQSKYFKNEDGITDFEALYKEQQRFTLETSEIVLDVLNAEYCAPYYFISALQILPTMPYLDENFKEDPWWAAYWYYQVYNMSKREDGFEDTCKSALEYYERHVTLKHLNITQDILSEWEQYCPFIDSDTGRCTLHPYDFD